MDFNHFSSKIDARVENYTLSELMALFDEALFISPQCVFRAVEEIVLSSYRMDKINATIALEYVYPKFEHPLKKIIFAIALNGVNNHRLSSKNTICAIFEVRQYRWELSCLNIIFACWNRSTLTYRIDRLHNQTIAFWENEDLKAL